ncbi:MAG: hypothetical protein ABJB78_01710 [Betaproteobacteria bacterium]
MNITFGHRHAKDYSTGCGSRVCGDFIVALDDTAVTDVDDWQCMRVGEAIGRR